MRRGAAGADRGQLVARRLHGLLHPLRGVGQQFVDQLTHALAAAPCALEETRVPTRSPATILSMLRSSAMLKTYIGRSLSMHSDSAVESITRSPRSIASRWLISGRKLAAGSWEGSAS